MLTQQQIIDSHTFIVETEEVVEKSDAVPVETSAQQAYTKSKQRGILGKK